MRNWVPVPGSTKGKLALLALAEFGRHGYDAVNVTELAAGAGVTTGSLYYHFGNKAGLYGFVREEAERRLIDRMEGAAAAVADSGDRAGLRAGLLVGFDFAVRERFAALLAEPHPERAGDPVERFLAKVTGRASRPLPRLLAAAWRAALAEATKGSEKEVRAALDAVVADVAVPSRGRQPLVSLPRGERRQR
jgi:AcrR family transcriptional regulator